MKKWIVLILALLILALPVSATEVTMQGSSTASQEGYQLAGDSDTTAEVNSDTTSQEGYKLAGNLVHDQEGLLDTRDREFLEAMYQSYAEEYGFTPILYTVLSFQGRSAEETAAWYYDSQGYPADGILYLVSLTEGEWYILTNGQCYHRIPNAQTQQIGDILVEYLRDGDYYEAFARFPELAEEAYRENPSGDRSGLEQPKKYGKTIAICMAVGLAIGAIAAGIMAARMKSVKPQQDADDYMRQGSMQLRNNRDIFLYSNVSRTPKPKNTSSSRSGGGGRGGAGGRI